MWSNNSKSDYAIKLKARTDTPLAATKNTEEYTDLVEESDYLEHLQYDWNYTLRHWIDIHTSNLITDVVSPFPKDTTFTVRKMYSQKPTLKCNYCKLMFNTETIRTQDEQSWHTAIEQQK